jgi:WD40 repeat protein
MIKYLQFIISFFLVFSSTVFSQECLKTIQADSLKVSGAVFSPDGMKFVTCGWDMKIKRWDSKSYSCLDTLVEHSGSVLNVAYSPDGKYLVSCGWDGKVIIWDAVTAKVYK